MRNDDIMPNVKEFDNKIELTQGMTAEKMLAEYFDEDALKVQPETVYRLDSRGHRYYYTFEPDGTPTFYTSVTTMIRQTMPTEPQLIRWMADMGYEEAQNYTQERASYGTFLHIQIGEFLINGEYDLDRLKDKLKLYIDTEQLPASFINYEDDLKRDILAFAQFALDVNLKPLAIELVLTNREDRYAGAIDLACDMDIEEKGFFGEVYKTGANKGQPKETKRKSRIRAIVDFKSGRKGFHESHEIQLAAYRKMWNIHFPDTPIERVYNWSPKEWRTAPGYNLKDQTDSPNAVKLPMLVELAKIEDSKRENVITTCSGVIRKGKALGDNIATRALVEVVMERGRNYERKN